MGSNAQMLSTAAKDCFTAVFLHKNADKLKNYIKNRQTNKKP